MTSATLDKKDEDNYGRDVNITVKATFSNQTNKPGCDSSDQRSCLWQRGYVLSGDVARRRKDAVGCCGSHGSREAPYLDSSLVLLVDGKSRRKGEIARKG
jgi:hypothetical protein